MLVSLRRLSQSELAQRHLEIIQFYEAWGEAATKPAYGADRNGISRGRPRLKKGGGHLPALIPRSTRPHRVRRSAIAPEVVELIRQLREKYTCTARKCRCPRLGKDKNLS